MTRAFALFALAGAVAIPAIARAQDAGEVNRLMEECRKLASRNAWSGVERNYAKLVKLTPDVPFEIHFLGGQAARSIGKVFELYERLTAAKNLDPKPEIIDELSAIDGTYGRVSFLGKEGMTPVLTPAVMPFAPDQRKAIEYAQTVLTETGSFTGMLPAGKYTLNKETADAQELDITPGPDFEEIRIEMKGPGVSVQWSGLVAHLGYNLGLSSEPGADPDVAIVQPGGFSGSGLAANLGYELGFSENRGIGVAFGAGYNGMFGVDTLHSVDGRLSFVLRPGDLRIAVGPSYAVHFGSGTGVASWFDVGHDQARFPNDSLGYDGVGGGPGAHLSVGYGVLDIGTSFKGSVELGGQWSTDGVRNYIDFGLRVGIIPLIDRFEG